MTEILLIIGALYLVFGLGFYLGLAIQDPEGFVQADAAAILRGLLLGVVFWPIGLAIKTYFAIEKLR